MKHLILMIVIVLASAVSADAGEYDPPLGEVEAKCFYQSKNQPDQSATFRGCIEKAGFKSEGSA